MKNINKRKEISIAQAKEIKSECKFLDDEICYIEPQFGIISSV